MSADPVKKLHTFMKKLPALGEETTPAYRSSHALDPIVAELVRAFFIWEAGLQAAERALAGVESATADYNELRVCLPHELEQMVGRGDKHLAERSLRLRSVLNDIYRREHELTLVHLATLPKREARAYLDALDGMPAFVSARVCLLAIGAHTVPVDARVVAALAEQEAIPAELESSPHAECASWLEHHIRAEESVAFHLRMERMLDADRPATPARKSAGAKPKTGTRSPKAPKTPRRRAQA